MLFIQAELLNKYCEMLDFNFLVTDFDIVLKLLNYIIYITIHYITLHYIILHYITLHYITLHYITLHYITLHYITLYYITSI